MEINHSVLKTPKRKDESIDLKRANSRNFCFPALFHIKFDTLKDLNLHDLQGLYNAKFIKNHFMHIYHHNKFYIIRKEKDKGYPPKPSCGDKEAQNDTLSPHEMKLLEEDAQ